MNLVLPLLVGALTAAGLYMIARRSTMKLVIGLSLLSHASHLLVFSTGGLVRGEPPLIEENQRALAAPYADPLPQALVLTAIVINFGVLAFAVALVSRAYRETGIDDIDSFRDVEELP